MTDLPPLARLGVATLQYRTPIRHGAWAMQIKTFSGDDAGQLEHNVANWLAAHPEITIAYIAQSMGRTRDGVDQIVLTLFYTEVAVTSEVAQPAAVATVVPPPATPIVSLDPPT